MIDGVRIKKLKRFPDGRGTLMKMMESSDDEFTQFGEIYFTTIYPGVVKGWHLHEEATVNFVALQGMVQVVIYDDRQGSTSYGELQEIYIGEENYQLIQIPNNVWHGIKCIGRSTALVGDLITLTHEEDVMRRMDPHDNDKIDYEWAVKDN